MQYIKDRIEIFDDYFPCKKNKYKLNHIKQWVKLFVDQHNKEIKSYVNSAKNSIQSIRISYPRNTVNISY
jgi:hypothetical protein